jgi:hypothetical protein
MIHITRKIATIVVVLTATSFCFGQAGKIKEYLGVAGPVSIGNASYNLSWSSHPSDEYYKQEYLVKGDQLERYKKMVLVEVLTGNTDLEKLVSRKVEEFKIMQASNPVVKYEVFKKDGEIILDFLLSENDAGLKRINVLERNVYRYKTIVERNGKKCLLLFAVSERAYGSDATEFLTKLKTNRSVLVKQVAAYNMPAIALSH